MNNLIAKTVFLGASRVRNPSLWQEYDRLGQSEYESADRLREIQITNAAEFFSFAGKHSPYYAELFKTHGFKPDGLTSLDDLRRIPPITKDELISCNDAIHADYIFPKVFLAETSGTTGGALEFRKSETWDSVNRAAMMRSYRWYGVDPWERNGYLWGYNIAPSKAFKTKLLDGLQNRFRMFNYDADDIARFAVQLQRASYVSGYSSMIYEVARAINRSDAMSPASYNLKLVKGTSEMILDVYRSATRNAFGCEIVSEYGAAESGLIAFECPHGRMHINVENVILEVDDNDEVIVTNLWSHSFPVIRYRLGDVVKLGADTPCPCKHAHPVVAEVAGRKGGTVYGRSKTYPALTFYYIFKNLAMDHSVFLNYKAVQYEKGAIEVFIEQPVPTSDESKLVAEMEKYFGDDVEYVMRYNSDLKKEKKKMQYFTSYVD